MVLSQFGYLTICGRFSDYINLLITDLQKKWGLSFCLNLVYFHHEYFFQLVSNLNSIQQAFFNTMLKCKLHLKLFHWFMRTNIFISLQCHLLQNSFLQGQSCIHSALIRVVEILGKNVNESGLNYVSAFCSYVCFASWKIQKRTSVLALIFGLALCMKEIGFFSFAHFAWSLASFFSIFCCWFIDRVLLVTRKGN